MTACQNNPTKVPAIDLANFDLSVSPNADFYQYATGGWQKNNPLKPEFSRYGSFDVLRENNEKRINALFQEMTRLETTPGSVEQKIADLYKMGLDSARLNAEGAAPLASDLALIDGLTDRAQLPGLLASIHMALANPFFGIGVMADLMDSRVNTLYVAQSGISMGDRDYYVDPSNAAIKEAYKAYLVRIFTLAGYDEAAAAQAAVDALEVEDSLAEVFFSNVEQRDLPAQYNPMTREEFARRYDALDWDAYFAAMKVYNRETEYELQKWEINKTKYPQLTGANFWLYRLYYFHLSGGFDKRFGKVDKKVNKIMLKAYEKKTPVSKAMRHRAIVWSCPANYYTNFAAWLENCWGINVVMDMETMISYLMFDTTDKEQSLHDLAKTYQRVTMRKHTKGGYRNVVDELWRIVEEFDADMVIMYDQISCKGMAGLLGVFDDQARERDVNFIWVQQDLMDCRTISRRDMREQVNKYMTSVLQEEPVDPTLVDFDDTQAW